MRFIFRNHHCRTSETNISYATFFSTSRIEDCRLPDLSLRTIFAFIKDKIIADENSQFKETERRKRENESSVFRAIQSNFVKRREGTVTFGIAKE